MHTEDIIFFSLLLGARVCCCYLLHSCELVIKL